jgi:hypothetical protein
MLMPLLISACYPRTLFGESSESLHEDESDDKLTETFCGFCEVFVGFGVHVNFRRITFEEFIYEM